MPIWDMLSQARGRVWKLARLCSTYLNTITMKFFPHKMPHGRVKMGKSLDNAGRGQFPIGFKMRKIFVVIIILIFPNLNFAADEIFVVLSSNLKPYQEAAAGFQKEYQGKVGTAILSEAPPHLSADVKIVVAIGGKAALFPYPDHVKLIYCLAPGVVLEKEPYKEKPIKIDTSPNLAMVVAKLKEIHPSLNRLGIPWVSDSIKQYLQEKETFKTMPSVTIEPTQLRDPKDLPDYLRSIAGKVDVLWLPLDSQLISPSSLAIIKEFSWANDVPFFSPTEGLADQTAVGSVSSSFGEMGRIAAIVARKISDGVPYLDNQYPERFRTTINLTAAKETNIIIPPEIVKTADRIIP